MATLELFPSASKQPKKAQEPEELEQKPTPEEPLTIQGDHWVTDEIYWRDIRDVQRVRYPAKKQVEAVGPDGKQLRDAAGKLQWRTLRAVEGGVQAGMCLQIRPYQDPSWINRAVIRVASGRTIARMMDQHAKGKTLDRDRIRFVVGATISCGNGKRVRIEGAIELHESRLDPALLRSLKTGLRDDAFWEGSDDRVYFRAVCWLHWPSLAGDWAYNDVISGSGLVGKTLVIRVHPGPVGGHAWLTFEVERGDDAEGQAQVALAVNRKAHRSSYGYQFHLWRDKGQPIRTVAPLKKRLDRIINRLEELAGGDYAATSELSHDLQSTPGPAMSLMVHTLELEPGWGPRKIESRRRRHYLPQFVRLLEFDAGMTQARGVASVLGTASPVAASETDQPGADDAAATANDTADDIE